MAREQNLGPENLQENETFSVQEVVDAINNRKSDREKALSTLRENKKLIIDTFSDFLEGNEEKVEEYVKNMDKQDLLALNLMVHEAVESGNHLFAHFLSIFIAGQLSNDPNDEKFNLGSLINKIDMSGSLDQFFTDDNFSINKLTKEEILSGTLMTNLLEDKAAEIIEAVEVDNNDEQGGKLLEINIRKHPFSTIWKEASVWKTIDGTRYTTLHALSRMFLSPRKKEMNQTAFKKYLVSGWEEFCIDRFGEKPGTKGIFEGHSSMTTAYSETEVNNFLCWYIEQKNEGKTKIELKPEDENFWNFSTKDIGKKKES